MVYFAYKSLTSNLEKVGLKIVCSRPVLKRNSELPCSPTKIKLKLPDYSRKRILEKLHNKMNPEGLTHFSPQNSGQIKLECGNSRNRRYFSPTPCIHSDRNIFHENVPTRLSSNFTHASSEGTTDNIFKVKYGEETSIAVKQKFPELFKTKIFNFTEDEESTQNI